MQLGLLLLALKVLNSRSKYKEKAVGNQSSSCSHPRAAGEDEVFSGKRSFLRNALANKAISCHIVPV